MLRIEEMALGNGKKVLVEVEEHAAAPGTRPVSRGAGRAIKATLGDALDEIRDVVEVIESKTRELDLEPDEKILELGVSMTTEAGVVLAKAAAEANLKLTLKWSGTTKG